MTTCQSLITTTDNSENGTMKNCMRGTLPLLCGANSHALLVATAAPAPRLDLQPAGQTPAWHDKTYMIDCGSDEGVRRAAAAAAALCLLILLSVCSVCPCPCPVPGPICLPLSLIYSHTQKSDYPADCEGAS